MDKTKPCKVFRAKSVKGIVIRIIVILSTEPVVLFAFYTTMVMVEEDYSSQINAGVICIAYFIRIIGIVAGSLGLKKVEKRENDLWVSIGINCLFSILAFFTLIGMIAREELEETLLSFCDPSMLFGVVLMGAMVGMFPAFCSIALFDWREDVKIKKKRKRGIYTPTAKKLDI